MREAKGGAVDVDALVVVRRAASEILAARGVSFFAGAMRACSGSLEASLVLLASGLLGLPSELSAGRLFLFGELERLEEGVDECMRGSGCRGAVG